MSYTDIERFVKLADLYGRCRQKPKGSVQTVTKLDRL